MYYKNLHHTYKLQKYTHNTDIKLKNYILNKNVCLNCKYIKTK